MSGKDSVTRSSGGRVQHTPGVESDAGTEVSGLGKAKLKPINVDANALEIVDSKGVPNATHDGHKLRLPERDPRSRKAKSKQKKAAAPQLDTDQILEVLHASLPSSGVKSHPLVKKLGVTLTQKGDVRTLSAAEPAASALIEIARRGELSAFMQSTGIDLVQAAGPDGEIRTLVPTRQTEDGRWVIGVEAATALLSELASHPKLPFGLAENGCPDRLEGTISESLLSGVPPDAIQRISTLTPDISLDNILNVQSAVADGTAAQKAKAGEIATVGREDKLSEAVLDKINELAPNDEGELTVVRVGDQALKILPSGQVSAGGYLPMTPGSEVFWSVGHIAMSVVVENEKGEHELMVLDPGFSPDHPLPIEEWKALQGSKDASIVHGPLGEKPALDPKYSSRSRLADACELVEEITGESAPKTRKARVDLVDRALSEMPEDQLETFYDRFFNVTGDDEPCRYAAWDGYTVAGGPSDEIDGEKVPFKDWNELELRSEEFNRRRERALETDSDGLGLAPLRAHYQFLEGLIVGKEFEHMTLPADEAAKIRGWVREDWKSNFAA